MPRAQAAVNFPRTVDLGGVLRFNGPGIAMVIGCEPNFVTGEVPRRGRLGESQKQRPETHRESIE